MDGKAIRIAADTVRLLTIDGIELAQSGHPGLPLGCAEFAVLLFGEILNHYPAEPCWINRDRFILSAGHGSMLLYSLLHLAGYDLTLDDIRNFRQLGSRTPGHPEHGKTPGVECTTGPLGQGIANAVGMAISAKYLAARFNTARHTVIDHYVYVLASDGDLMEGLSYEAASLAGHLGLDRMIVFYDSNRITIDGSTELTFTEDITLRFEAMNWQVASVDAYDLEGILQAVNEARATQGKPSLIILNSIIAKGAPSLAGKHKAHSSPLGGEEVRAIKRALGVAPDELFHVDPRALAYFKQKTPDWQRRYNQWTRSFQEWRSLNPTLSDEWDRFFAPFRYDNFRLPAFRVGESLSTRRASGIILNALADEFQNLIGGSADLGDATETILKKYPDFQKDVPSGRNIHFGVREHAMGGICNGIALYGGIRAFCATLLVFSDYMRPAIRLAALMGLPIIYVFTHDSIFVGEDGPTHQPVEQIASLRIIPGLLVLRPADAQETASAWRIAMENHSGPTALILSRQDIETFEKQDPEWESNFYRGAYLVKDCQGTPELIMIATGSEVSLALRALQHLKEKPIRLVSMTSRELFQCQPVEYKNGLIQAGTRLLILEAGISMGWESLGNQNISMISVDRFGLSGPGDQVANQLGISYERVLTQVTTLIGSDKVVKP